MAEHTQAQQVRRWSATGHRAPRVTERHGSPTAYSRVSCDPPAGLVLALPLNLAVVILEVISKEVTPANHLSEFEHSVEFNEAMTTRLADTRHG